MARHCKNATDGTCGSTCLKFRCSFPLGHGDTFYLHLHTPRLAVFLWHAFSVLQQGTSSLVAY